MVNLVSEWLNYKDKIRIVNVRMMKLKWKYKIGKVRIEKFCNKTWKKWNGEIKIVESNVRGVKW